MKQSLPVDDRVTEKGCPYKTGTTLFAFTADHHAFCITVRIEAKRILTRLLQNLDLIESFILDTERDKRYAQVEAKLQMASQFSPQDQEVKDWQSKIKAMRAKSRVDIEKALDAARFPAAFTGFAGPGNVVELAASALKYFNQEGGNEANETTVKVVVAGNWVVAKRNIFDEPIPMGTAEVIAVWAHRIAQ